MQIEKYVQMLSTYHAKCCLNFNKKSNYFNHKFSIQLSIITGFGNGQVLKRELGPGWDVTSSNQDKTETNQESTVKIIGLFFVVKTFVHRKCTFEM